MSDAGEIIKSGAMSDLTGLLKEFLGPSAQELGEMFGDTMRSYRTRNAIRVAEKTRQMLDEAGLPTNAVPGRLLLPILENSSAEDDDELQKRWAGLLASASEQGDALSPSFSETLKQLTPAEAKHLDHVFKALRLITKQSLTTESSIPYELLTKEAPKGCRESFERLGLIRREYQIDFNHGFGLNYTSSNEPTKTITSSEVSELADEVDSAMRDLDAEIDYALKPTAYCFSFLHACRGPVKKAKV